MEGWRPLWEIKPEESERSVRVIMAGHDRCSTTGRYEKVGEAFWGDPDERGGRWIWADGGDVINPVGYQPLPEFPK
jgi:hypothetical protein